MRPAPGAQVAAGRLRVDATKAIAKLREYQLVDRTAWILEAIRAAVAAGATSIDLQGDSNDVWLSWTGAPWPAEDLPSLFDELVSPEPAASRHHVRLLAAAVNSALGTNPAYVDVYTIGDGGAVRARYTPDVLEAPASELDDSPLREVQPEPAPIPRGVAKGMHVHVRRRASLQVLSHWLRAADPPELVLARAACGDIATPIRIGSTTFDRATSQRDVVRVPLGVDVEGWVAITDTPRPEIELALAERGVLLEATTIDLGLAPIAPIPMRVVIDAPRLPTNASRSEVRRDVHPVATAERRAREVVPALIAKLVERCASDPRAQQAAIHLVASAIGGADWAHRAREIAGPLRALAELPLVRDAAGTPRPIAWSWSGLVHVDDKPLPSELAPWLTHVLWAPPSDAAMALTRWSFDPGALAVHLKQAKRERRAARKFYKHAPCEPRVLGRRKPRVRARLGAPLAASSIPDEMFDGLAGEVCVYGDFARLGELTLLLGGREIETVEFDSAVSFAAVIDSAHLAATDLFRRVQRDAEYARVERAMRAGVVRALEALALARVQRFVDGYQVAVDASSADAPMLRSGVLLSRNLGVPLSAAFEHAEIWPTTDGDRSVAQLRRHAVLGVAPAQAVVSGLEDRPIICGDDVARAVLATLVPAQLVTYEPGALAKRVTAAELATEIMGTVPHALAIAEDELEAAIVPADKPQLLLYHRGKRLGELAYVPTLAPCTIAVDCDRIVPTAAWDGIADPAELHTRDYTAWEHRLAREAVKAIVGERSQDLLGGRTVDLDGVLGRWLCVSLLGADVLAVLGEKLVRQLEVIPLFRVLGEAPSFSIAELAVMFPATITFVDAATEPVAGFPCLLANTLVARVVAKLAKRKFRNAANELAQRRSQLARELRLGMHRAKPLYAIEIAGVEIATELGRGVVGVGRDVCEIQILVEGRLFQTVTRVDEPPLAAVVELANLDGIDDRCEAVRLDIVERVIAFVREAAPRLVEKLVHDAPDTLAEAGPHRALLASVLAKQLAPAELRTRLARAVRFPTVQGDRRTLLDARSGPTIQTCTWTGEWLGPDGDDHALDRPVLLTAGAPEVAAILAALGNVVDVSPEIETLQAHRRMTRGLLPTPKVTGADPALTRRLADLGPAYRHLGLGEVALVGGESEVLLHVHGELRERVPLACRPSIQLAIEGAELVGDRADLVEQRLGDTARELAGVIVQHVLLTRPVDTLPVDIRRSLRRGVLTGYVEHLHTAPLFETVTGAWIDLGAVQAQRELFGELWAVPSPAPDARPLDDRRVVLVLSPLEQALATEHGIPVIDARIELALDAKARRNRARPPATSLALDDVDGVIATVELTGDGVTSPRGMVAVLAPDAADRRELRLHRGMHPFDAAADPCRWPTLALIDDARLTPDRCWDGPERDVIYDAAIDAIHHASDEALRMLVQPPANALASVRIGRWTHDSVTLLRAGDVQLRGAMWIDGPPLPAVTPVIRVREAAGETTFAPQRGLGIAGTLYVHAPDGFRWPRETTLEALSRAMHVKLVREMSLAHRHSPDLVSAHVAHALALERIARAEAQHIQFTCFRPTPLDAFALAALLADDAPVVVVPPHASYDAPCLVDDGSETARVIRHWLGDRVRPPSMTRKRRDTVEPPPPPIVEHPLQPFVNRLHARIVALGVQVPQWRLVDDRRDPIVHHDGDTLELGAANRHIITTAAAVAAKTAWADDAVDAIAAHCITVLNVALASITDATEARAIGKLLG